MSVCYSDIGTNCICTVSTNVTGLCLPAESRKFFGRENRKMYKENRS